MCARGLATNGAPRGTVPLAVRCAAARAGRHLGLVVHAGGSFTKGPRRHHLGQIKLAKHRLDTRSERWLRQVCSGRAPLRRMGRGAVTGAPCGGGGAGGGVSCTLLAAGCALAVWHPGRPPAQLQHASARLRAACHHLRAQTCGLTTLTVSICMPQSGVASAMASGSTRRPAGGRRRQYNSASTADQLPSCAGAGQCRRQ